MKIEINYSDEKAEIKFKEQVIIVEGKSENPIIKKCLDIVRKRYIEPRDNIWNIKIKKL